MMGDLSFVEKLKVFVDVSSSSGICIGSIFILIFLSFMILTTNKKNSKSTKLLFIGIYIVIVLVMLLQYNDSLNDMFDYMMNNFFIVFYFPNVAIYLAAIIATNIILWVTIFNFKEDRLLKVINTIVYCLIHYLLILILNVINDKSLDIFSQTSIYGNEKTSALINLTSIVFIVWIIFIIIYKIIRASQTNKAAVINKDIRVLNPNIIEVDVPSLVKAEPIKRYPKKVVQTDLIEFYKDNNVEQAEIKKYDNILSLEDYRIVLNILKNKPSSINQNIKQDKNIEKNTSFIPKNYNNISIVPTRLDELLNI